jgi:hypothetical protein
MPKTFYRYQVERLTDGQVQAIGDLHVHERQAQLAARRAAARIYSGQPGVGFRVVRVHSWQGPMVVFRLTWHSELRRWLGAEVWEPLEVSSPLPPDGH